MTTNNAGTGLAELTGTYTLDPAHIRIGFVARHAMVTNADFRVAHPGQAPWRASPAWPLVGAPLTWEDFDALVVSREMALLWSSC